jgi:dTDP-4-dehydrorhamnose reductase
VILNCGAYTAVDKAEKEPELADIVNHQAVKTIAQYAKEHQVQLIHISTDYVLMGIRLLHCKKMIDRSN